MNIGIIGTGRITERFVQEVNTIHGIRITAIYNPRIQSAKCYVRDHGMGRVLATDDMDEFTNAVDAAYVAGPHETHVGYVRSLLEKGVHVLCEKPLAFSCAEAAELFVIARSEGCILMEAVKTAYCPGFKGLLDLIGQGVIGQVHDVEACFTKIGTAAGREMWGEYGGSFYELGSYTLLPIVKLLGMESKESYIWSYDAVTGVDAYTKTVIAYENAVSTMKTGLGVKSEGELIIAGEKGYIKVPSPWWLTTQVEVHHENPGRVETYNYPFAGGGLRYEIQEFMNKVTVLETMKEEFSIEMMADVWEEIEYSNGLTPDESIWMAQQMEHFAEYVRVHKTEKSAGVDNSYGSFEDILDDAQKQPMNIWAHRGCSMKYPENTLLAFEKAAQIKGIKGVELDVQLTLDGEMVVIHDEMLNRTTTGTGYVQDYTLSEIKEFKITPSGQGKVYEDENGNTLTVPTLEEVFEVLKPYCIDNGLMINIELKNSVLPYTGMEEKVIALVEKMGIHDNIVYSSFNHSSMGVIKNIDSTAQTGILSGDCYDAIEGLKKYKADALHPWVTGLCTNPETIEYYRENNIPVRIWNGEEPLFGQDRPYKGTDWRKYDVFGVTDTITNVPEEFLK